MAFSKQAVIDTAREVLDNFTRPETVRLDRIARALHPKVPTVQLPATPTVAMQELAKKAQTNYLPLILDVMAQVLIVDGYRPSTVAENSPVWGVWQRNRFDARQTGVHRDALAYGVGYVTVLPGDDGPAMRPVSPRKMTAVYGDPVEDDWPLLALRHDNDLLRLFDEDQVYYLGRERNGTRLEFVEARAHGLGVCPVVRYRDRMLTDECDQVGIIEPLIPIQARTDETVFGLLTAQYYAAFKQRYVAGWIPDNEAQMLQTAASQLWAFADPDVKVGDLPETDLTRYLESKDSAVGDMATIAQVPKQNLGVGNVANMSAEALAAMEASKDRKAAEIQTSLGESHEQTFELCAGALGVDVDREAQVRWKDSTVRSFAQMVDGLGKMVQMLGVPQEAAWERIPGVTDGDMSRWRQLAEQADSLGSFTALLARQGAGLNDNATA